MILCSNPHAQYLAHKEEIDEAVHRVLDSGWYILGDEVEAFEREFADYVGVSHGVGVGNGTEAISLVLSACGVGRGDEVITVSHTAVATAAAIGMIGAKPVLVDVDKDYFTMDPDAVESAINERTRAVVPVHIYGQPAPIDDIVEIARRHEIRVVEDCAQAHGASYKGRPVGSWGDAACFSFYPTKNLGALGDGGIVVTEDEEIATRARLLREYGWAERFVSTTPGWNSRLDEMQAALLRAKLKYLDEDNDLRRDIARHYDAVLGPHGIQVPSVRPQAFHVFHLYVVRHPKRDRLLKHLRDTGVGASIHYPFAVHQQPTYALCGAGRSLCVTERTVDEILSLPIYPELSEEDVETVVSAVKAFPA